MLQRVSFTVLGAQGNVKFPQDYLTWMVDLCNIVPATMSTSPSLGSFLKDSELDLVVCETCGTQFETTNEADLEFW
jgi:hypothetical protein